MPDIHTFVPRISSSVLQADAPSLLTFNSAHPNISIITPSSPDYSTVRQEYNCCNTTVPLAIIFPINVAQLVAAIKYCTSQSPPIAITVRGGGHDAYGRNALAGAVQLDLRLMKWTKISPPESESRYGNATVTVGPGTTAIEMQRALDAVGLAAPTGWLGTVGVIGWACGGGYGLEAGMWGLGVDNIVGAKLVTPEGILVDTDGDADLLWAVRGAGLGNFGVICELRLKAYPNPRYLAGFLVFPLVEGERVFGGFQRMNDEEGIPRNFSAELTVNTTQLGPSVNFLFAWITEKDEDVAAGWAYLGKLKALGTVLLDTVAETSILKFHEFIHTEPDFNARGYTTMHSLALPRLSPDLIRMVMDRPPPANGTSAILFHHAHGRALQIDPTTAWAHRDEHYIWTLCGFAKPDATPQEQEVPEGWSDNMFRTAFEAHLGLEKAYWSLSRPEHCDAVRYFGLETVNRLRELKKKYNPGNAFPAALPVLEYM